MQEDLKKYLLQDEILAMKRMKKTKKEEPVNIKNMARCGTRSAPVFMQFGPYDARAFSS